ncbi:MAG: serine/threonine protein kinase, partial [Candidatus Obscuribacterales bacterium]|nr:serine/threonine protein kinase [Candidatus Obscuribacterales bacterium]
KNTVVLKEYVLPLGVSHASKAESLEKFQLEAQILGQLDHPQIVKLVDFFFEDHRGYMVLEYVQGRNLQSLCHSEGALSESKVIELAKQMSMILDYLHTRKPAIIHRDFTPDNLILTADGTLKLIDFNVAQQQKLSATATVVGKHSYIAPDQFRGQATPQSDIYSMGASIAYLLTGTEPKPISSTHPKMKNPQVSDEMDAIVAKCTAIDPSRRFASAAEFRQALDSLSGSPAKVTNESE